MNDETYWHAILVDLASRDRWITVLADRREFSGRVVGRPTWPSRTVVLRSSNGERHTVEIAEIVAVTEHAD